MGWEDLLEKGMVTTLVCGLEKLTRNLMILLRNQSREEHSYSLQYSFLENPMDRGYWGDTVQGGCKELEN